MRTAACLIVFIALVSCRDARSGVEMAPDVFVVTEQHPLDVAGDSFSVARQTAASAFGEHGRPSITNVYAQWQYWFRENTAHCYVSSARVDLRVTIQSPRWLPAVGTAPSEITLWNSWLALRQRISERRIAAAVRVARELVVALEGLPMEHSCSDLNVRVRAVAFDGMNRVRAAVDAIDEKESEPTAPADL